MAEKKIEKIEQPIEVKGGKVVSQIPPAPTKPAEPTEEASK